MNNPGPRRFRVHARHLGSHHGRVVSEASFEAAAIAYVEDLPLQADGAEELRIIVRELDSGHEHCFRFDLATGDTAPCG